MSRPMTTQQEKLFSSKAFTYFLQLVETMNYTQAAQILGITQPALTQQMKKLERIVGSPLFYSVGKKLKLSDAGYTLLRATHEINDVLNAATDEIQQASSAERGEIRIGVLSSIDPTVFERFVAEYYQENSEVRLGIYMLTRKEIWEELENNQIDFAIMYLPDSHISSWQTYEKKPIVDEELMFVHSVDKKVSKKIKTKDTLDRPWTMYPSGFYLDQVIVDRYQNDLVSEPNVVARFTNPSQIYQFAKETGTYTALPDSYVNAHQDKHFQASSFDPEIHFTLAFVYRNGKNKIPRISRFLGRFDEYLAEKSYFERLK